MAKLWQFSEGRPKREVSEKVERGDQEKFLENRQKSSPRLKGPKSLLRKWHYHLINMYLKFKHSRRFWSKKAASKKPE